MKIYSYRINVDEKIQKNVQLSPFINSKEKSINTEIINALKSDKVKINELNFDINKPIISWEIFSSPNNDIYNFFQDKISNTILSKDISKKSIHDAILRFNWKFEKINFNKKKILSLGCGDGMELFFLRYKFPDSKIYAVDWEKNINSNLLKILNVEYEENNIYEYLKNNENKFDFIYSSYFLEHSYDVDLLFTLINKSLVSDGILASNLPLISYYGTSYYNFLKKALIHKKISQIDGGLIDVGHAWKTNEYDLCKTLEINGFNDINIYGNANSVVPHKEITMEEYIKSANLKFKLNNLFIKPFKSIINMIFGNNINYWILKIFIRITRSWSIADGQIANFVPEVLFTAKKND